MNASLQLFIYLSKTLKEHSSYLGGDPAYVQHLLGLLYKHSPELLDPAQYSSHYMVLFGSLSLALDLNEAHNDLVKKDLTHTLQWILTNDISSRTLLEASPQEILNLEWTWDILMANIKINDPKVIDQAFPSLSGQGKEDAPQPTPIILGNTSFKPPVEDTVPTSAPPQQTIAVCEQSNQDDQALDEHHGNKTRTVAGAPMEVHDLKGISDSFDKSNQRK